MCISLRSSVVAVGLTLLVAGSAQADVVLWYNGDLQTGGGGTVNEETTNGGSFNTYDNFNVTGPGGWIVDRVWSNDSMQFTGVTQASWSIRTGMSVGNGGTVVASGIGTATQTPTGRTNPSLGFLEYTIQVSGLNVALAPGSYWLSVSPLVGADPAVSSGGVFRSYNSTTTGTNAVGTPPGNDTNGLLNSPFLSDNFVATNSEFSMGVAGALASPSVPEPASAVLLGLGAGGLVTMGRLRRNPSLPRRS
jgi:hypothetical protein